jgi:lysophospholipase L1-like esterase
VHVSIGGDRVRLVFSNAFGTGPLTLGAAHVALRQKDSATVPASDRTLTFSGRGSATLSPGSILLSDPVKLTVTGLSDLAIDLYLPGDEIASGSAMTVHNGAGQTNFVSGSGNFAGSSDFPVSATTNAWYFLQRVEVIAPESVGALVAFGDSITDGTRSTPDSNNRWPDELSRRINGVHGGARMGVINAGIAGNRLLVDGLGINALARFDRDVLTQAGASCVIVLHGGNDIGARQQPVSLPDLIAAHQQLIARAHATGLRVIGSTLTPFEGSGLTAWTPEAETARNGFNVWVKTGKAYDAFIDFDTALRDPANPSRIQKGYNSGDNLHPNDAGYRLMGDLIDLKLVLKCRAASK